MISIDIKKQLGDFQLQAKFDAPMGVTAIFGQSGSGKTSVVNAVAGLLRPDAGRISVDDTVLYDSDDLSPASVEVLEKMGGEREGWQVREVVDYTGAEEELVVVVGSGDTEGISRARGGMGLVTVAETEKGKEMYEIYRLAFVQAEKLGLVQLVLNNGQ